MVAQFRISLFEDIVVSARISKTGQPIAQPGDIHSQTIEIKNTNTETINLIMSKILE